MDTRNAEPSATPLISCLMVSRGRLTPARFAIECYRRQTWPNRELVIVSAALDSDLPGYLATLRDPTIRFLSAPPVEIGALRNISVEAARGTLLCNWDDDDLCHPQRLEYQYAQLVANRAAAHFFSRLVMWWPDERRLAISSRRLWEVTMLCRRFALGSYPPTGNREDTRAVKAMRERGTRVTHTDQPFWYCYIVHGRNSTGLRRLTKLFMKATETFGSDEYATRLDQLSLSFPIHAYRAALPRSDRGVPERLR
jgi:glycosyltransferase involved in cell wall biosynthesis